MDNSGLILTLHLTTFETLKFYLKCLGLLEAKIKVFGGGEKYGSSSGPGL